MSGITNIYNLPNDILVGIFNYTGETNIGPVCKLWNQVYNNTLHNGLITSPEFIYSDSNINSSTTTELIKKLFQKAVQLGIGEKANEIMRSNALLPLHMKLSKIQACNEQTQIHAYYQFIQAIDSNSEDTLASIRDLELPLNQELEKLKELFKTLNLQTLTKLDIHGKYLKTLPKEIGDLQALTNLYLSDNQLKTLPKEIGDLQNLIYVSLQKNKLTTLPPELFQLGDAIFEVSGNPIEYLPSLLISKVMHEDHPLPMDYAFHLSSDMRKLQTLQNNEITFEDLPIRLRNLVKQSEDIQSLLSKMQELNKLKTDFIASKSLDVLKQILNFPTDGLHEQQIIEVIVELITPLQNDDHPLLLIINQAVATALGLDLEEEPDAGFWKFFFRPLDPEIKQAVLALESNDNSSQAAYALLSKEKEENALLFEINTELLEENESLKQEVAKVSTLEKTINRQALKLEQAKEYQETLEADSKKEKEGLQSEISSLKEQLLEKEEKDIYQKRKAAFLTAGIKIFSQNGELLKHLDRDFNEQYWSQMKLVYKSDIDFETIEQAHPLSNN